MALKIGKTTKIENPIIIYEVKITANHHCKRFTYKSKTEYNVPEDIEICNIILKYKYNGKCWKSNLHYFLDKTDAYGCYTRDRLFKKQKEIIINDIYNNIQTMDDIADYREKFMKELLGRCIFVKDC